MYELHEYGVLNTMIYLRRWMSFEGEQLFRRLGLEHWSNVDMDVENLATLQVYVLQIATILSGDISSVQGRALP